MLNFISRIIENRFAKTSLILVVIQGLTLIVSFFGNVLLAGIYKNPAGFGEFNYYFSIITTLGYSVTFGMDTYILKKNTESHHHQDNSGIAEIVGKSLRITLLFAVGSAMVLLVVNTKFFTFFKLNDLYLALGIIFSGLLVMRSYTLRSFGELLYSNLFNNSIKTLMFYLFVVIVCALPFDFDINIGVMAFVLATIACWLCIEFLLIRWNKSQVVSSNLLSYRYLLSIGAPFFMYDLVGNFAVNIDIFLIEFAGNEYLLGQYSFYKKLSMIPFMAIAIVGTVLQTRYLEVYQNQDRTILQKMVSKTNRWTFVFALLSCIGLIVCFSVMSRQIHFFRDYFAQYYGYEHFLYILCAGEVLCSAFGPSNYFMLMLGLEKAAVVIDVFFVGLLVLLGLVLVYYIGYVGFGWAYVIARVLKNIFMWLYIKKKAQISFFIF